MHKLGIKKISHFPLKSTFSLLTESHSLSLILGNKQSCTDTSSHTSNLSIGKGIGVEGFGRGMEQGEEVKKKGGVPLDFEKLFASQDDDDDVEPPLPEVATTIVDDDVEQKQREELQKMRDRELEEAIAKFGRTLKAVGLNLPDGGVKMKANIKRYQDELDRRRLRRLEKVHFLRVAWV